MRNTVTALIAGVAAEIPVCNRNLGTLAIVEPDNQWWREYNLGSVPRLRLQTGISAAARCCA